MNMPYASNISQAVSTSLFFMDNSNVNLHGWLYVDASNTMAGSKSILLFATNKGNIYAMDLMTMDILWQLKNPLSHGK